MLAKVLVVNNVGKVGSEKKVEKQFRYKNENYCVSVDANEWRKMITLIREMRKNDAIFLASYFTRKAEPHLAAMVIWCHVILPKYKMSTNKMSNDKMLMTKCQTTKCQTTKCWMTKCGPLKCWTTKCWMTSCQTAKVSNNKIFEW
jgi:hypothetical protein